MLHNHRGVLPLTTINLPGSFTLTFTSKTAVGSDCYKSPGDNKSGVAKRSLIMESIERRRAPPLSPLSLLAEAIKPTPNRERKNANGSTQENRTHPAEQMG